MRSVKEQQALVTASAVAPNPVRVAIQDSLGLMCAEEVETTMPLPGFDQAAIDGFAVRAVDVKNAPTTSDPSQDGVVLPVVGDVTAGSRMHTRLQPDQTVRVFTGAAMPALADAVVPLAWTDNGETRVTINRRVNPGDFVRKVGDDVTPGDIAVRAGTIVGPAQVGLLAAVGRDKVLVHPRPRVSIISVGNELVDLDRIPGQGQVYDVASYALTAAALEAGAEVHRVGIVSTEPRAFRELVETQLLRSEIVVIAGAVGGIASEHVRNVLADLGEVEVERVAMHPGSVQGFGLLGADQIPTFLVPSNAVSALLVFELMVRPMIRIALGKRHPMRRIIRARTIIPVTSMKGRAGYLCAQLMRDEATGEYLVQALAGANPSTSHLLASLSEANALIVVPPDVTEIRTGEEVDVMFLAQRR